MPKTLKAFNLEPLPSVAVSRWYLSLQYYWQVYAVIFVPIVFAELQSYNAPGSKLAMLNSGLHKEDLESLWLRWTLVKLAVALITYLLLLAYDFFLKHKGFKNIKAFHLAFIGIAVGLINGYMQHFLIGRLEIFESGTYFARITAPITLTVVMLFTLSVLTSNIIKYRKNNEIAEKELSALSSVSEKQKHILQSYADYTKSVQERVHKTSQSAIKRLDSLRGRENLMNPLISEEIRLISDTTIRELSHEIEKSYTNTKVDKISNSYKNNFEYYFQLFNESIRFSPLQPFVFSFAYVFLISGAFIRHAQWYQALAADIALFLIIFAVQYFGVFLYKRFGWQNIYSVMCIGFLSANVPLALLSINFLNSQKIIPDLSKYPPAPLLFTSSLLAVTFIGYIQQAGLMASADLIKFRKSKIVNSKNLIKPLNKEIVQISRNWARHLHGPIQAQILAETLALENAQKLSDLRAIEDSIGRISLIFAGANDLKIRDSFTLYEELLQRVSYWGELIEIEFRISEEIKSKSGYQVYVVGDIIEEMIANASRHGLATRIVIEIERRNATHITIRATDNGTHFNKLKKGFGSRFFDEVSMGRWEITRSYTLRETTVELIFELDGVLAFRSIPQ